MDKVCHNCLFCIITIIHVQFRIIWLLPAVLHSSSSPGVVKTEMNKKLYLLVATCVIYVANCNGCILSLIKKYNCNNELCMKCNCNSLRSITVTL